MDKVTFKKDPHSDGYLIRTAGWVARFAKVDLGPTRCGEITDGIALDLCDCERPNKCQWHPGGVISFADLEAIYLAAKAERNTVDEGQNGTR